ncbi:TetR/AcrR family transcriptional regulator [Nocardia sp. NPDC049707]|uniref:TetR/AcrR family transcriptional regulator n=1 Tax=Nocardia sp. NPDC049707 TaxID=3154735 RepID=UPI003412931E
MGRPAKHSADRLLDAAATLLAESGPAAVTMSAVARAAGAPSGSVYHRFPDRSALLSALWLRTLTRFHEGVLATLAIDPPELAVRRTARHAVDWARRHPGDAAVVAAGAEELGLREWDDAARESTRRGNAAVQEAIADVIRRLGGGDDRTAERVLVAVVDVPAAMIRRYLRSGRPIPSDAADLAERAAAALLS